MINFFPTRKKDCVDNDSSKRNRLKNVNEITISIPDWGKAYKIQYGNELLASHTDCLKEIKQLVSVGPKAWDKLYHTPIFRFAEFVQLLPASQYHHHDHAGGLLEHTLQTVRNSLKIRAGQILPAGENPEAIGGRADRWTWGVFASALCHDLAKPLLDIVSMVFDSNHKPLGRWNPFKGPLTSLGNGSYYHFQYLQSRKYENHSLASPFLTSLILLPDLMDWLSRDQEALILTLKTIGGSDDNTIARIIKIADSESVRVNIGAQRLPRADQSVSSIGDKLLKALTSLIRDKVLPLNRKGAAGFVKGGAGWFISKRLCETLRESMMSQGHLSVPKDNNRLMDVLLEYGIIIPVDSETGKAIWNVKVSIGDDWSQRFTVLKIDPAKVLTSENEIGEFQGEIVVENDSFDDDIPTKLHDETSAEAKLLQAEAGVSTTIAPFTNHKSLDSLSDRRCNAGDTEVVGKTNFVSDKIEAEESDTLTSERATKLLTWIREGLANGSIPYNGTGAKVHVVLEANGEKSVLLVSPALFKLAINSIDSFNSLSLSQAQKAFQSLGLHSPGPNSENFTGYKIEGRRSSASIRGYKVMDWGMFFDMEPKANPVMKPLN